MATTSSSSSLSSPSTCCICWRSSWGTILYPGVYSFCCFALITQESYYASQDCPSTQMLKLQDADADVRWFLRSAALLVMPLTFAMTMDTWPVFGDFCNLSFHCNERSKAFNKSPRCCRLECIFPALLVGGSTYFLIIAIVWWYCAPIHATVSASIGIGLVVGGFGFSWYLRDWATCFPTIPECPTIAARGETATTDVNANENHANRATVEDSEAEFTTAELMMSSPAEQPVMRDGSNSSSSLHQRAITPQVAKGIGASDLPSTV